MKPIDINQMKEIELNILKYVDGICKENNIKYSLAGGTLLGAIRHQGFIPWDDDIDIILVRSEYERLIDILKRGKIYKLIYPEMDNYWHPFAKLVDPKTIMVLEDKYETNIPDLGVYIDIFAVDGCPDERKNQISFQRSLRKELNDIRLSFFNSYNASGKRWKRIVKRVVLFPKFIYLRITGTPQKRKMALLEHMKKYKLEESRYAGFLLSVYDNEILPKEYYTDTIEVQFENGLFQGLKNYDEYLKALYHDYMILPPEEKRKSAHHYKAFYR